MADLTPEELRVREMFGTSVSVKPIHEEPKEIDDSDADVVELITRICYFYPQYTLKTAQELTNSEATALLLQAEKQRAIEMYNYALIAAAPHSTKGKMVKELTKQYRKIVDL